MGFTLEFRVHSIAAEPFECPNVSLSKTVWIIIDLASSSNGIYPWILCLLYISWILWTVFMNLHTNVPLSKTVIRTYDPATQTQCQGQTSRSLVLPLNLFPLNISWTLWAIFIKLHANVSLGEMMCRTQLSAMQSQCQKSHFKVMRFCGGDFICPSFCCLV